MLVLYLEDIQKDDESRKRATLHRRDPQKRTLWREHWEREEARSRGSHVPLQLPRMRLPFWLFHGFFPPTDCPTVNLGTQLSSGLRALYSLILRILPTRLNGSLVRACTRLLRLLAATCCSWHSYLNVISMFLRTILFHVRITWRVQFQYLILTDIRLP